LPGSLWSRRARTKKLPYEFRRALALSPEVSLVKAALGHSLGMLGEKREARAILAELENLRSQKFVPAYDIAVVRLGLGEKAAALDWLRKPNANIRAGWLIWRSNRVSIPCAKCRNLKCSSPAFFSRGHKKSFQITKLSRHYFS
jgi:hypothetical protein